MKFGNDQDIVGYYILPVNHHGIIFELSASKNDTLIVEESFDQFDITSESNTFSFAKRNHMILKDSCAGAQARSLIKKDFVERFRRRVLFLLFVFCSQAFGFYDESADLNQKMDEGWAAFKNRQFQESIDHWEEAAALYKTMEDGADSYLRAQISMAAAYRSLQAHKEASQLLDEALEYAAQEGLENRILLPLLFRDYKPFAIDSKGNELMIDGVIAFNNRWFLESVRHWDQAAALYDTAVSGEVASGRIYLCLAVVYETLRDKDKQKNMLKEALKRSIPGDYSSDTTLLAILSFDQKKYAIDRSAHRALVEGLVAFSEGQFKNSISLWKKAIKRYEAIGENLEITSDIRIFQAAAYKSMGKDKKAIQLLETVMKRMGQFGAKETAVLSALFDGYEMFAGNLTD